MKKENQSKERYRALIKASIAAISADILLIALKSTLAYITGNIVLSADALHSTGDFAVSFTVLLSIIINNKFKDKEWAKHAEGTAAFFISFFLILGSISLILGVISNKPEEFILVSDIPLVVAIMGISLAIWIALYMAKYKKNIGEKHNSIAFLAEGLHTFSDSFTSIGVFITLLLGYFGIHIERFTTLIVGLIVLKIGFEIFLKALINFNITIFEGDNLKKKIISIYKSIPEPIRKKIPDLSHIKNFIPQSSNSLILFIKQLSPEIILNYKNRIIFYNLILIVLLYIGTGFYSIQPHQVGMEIYFGKVSSINKPGLHYHIPSPFGKVIRVDTELHIRLECGFETIKNFEGKEPEAYLWEFSHKNGKYKKIPDDSMSLTGDENLVDTNFLCYYKITDPVKFTLNIENTHNILKTLLLHEIRSTIGYYSLDDILTLKRKEIQIELLEKLKKSAVQLDLGVEILKIFQQETHPPLQVIPQYRSVASAREKKEEIIQKANAFANNLLPMARGKSNSNKLNSSAYAIEKKLITEGLAKNFELRHQDFSRNYYIHKVRLWWDSIEKILKNKTINIIPKNSKKRIFPNSESEEKVEPPSRNKTSNIGNNTFLEEK